MFKLTGNDKTIIGCNHDAWVTEPQLKFTTKGYGAAFTGATRYQGTIAPQSGMNVHGLVFTTLTIYPPLNRGTFKGIPITDRTDFLESVLQQCKTLEEVEQYYSKHNRSCFIQDLFVYIDSSGRVLFVEPYLMHYNTDSTLVQSNFCPSETTDYESIKQERFVLGNSFIESGYKAEFDFARAMIEKMSVSRQRHGDGTLISTVWDNQNLKFDVIFYHNFDSIKSYDLKEALLDGDKTYSLEQIFPRNNQFEELKQYRTPFNTPVIRLFLAFVGGVSGILGLLFLITVLRTSRRSLKIFWSIDAVAAILGFGYCYILATDIAMFYYDWPYIHPGSLWRTVLAFSPILLLLTLGMNLFYSRKLIKRRSISLILANLLYVVLLLGFVYWSF